MVVAYFFAAEKRIDADSKGVRHDSSRLRRWREQLHRRLRPTTATVLLRCARRLLLQQLLLTLRDVFGDLLHGRSGDDRAAAGRCCCRRRKRRRRQCRGIARRALELLQLLAQGEDLVVLATQHLPREVAFLLHLLRQQRFFTAQLLQLRL